MACDIEPEEWQCLLSIFLRQLKRMLDINTRVGIAAQVRVVVGCPSCWWEKNCVSVAKFSRDTVAPVSRRRAQ